MCSLRHRSRRLLGLFPRRLHLADLALKNLHRPRPMEYCPIVKNKVSQRLLGVGMINFGVQEREFASRPRGSGGLQRQRRQRNRSSAASKSIVNEMRSFAGNGTYSPTASSWRIACHRVLTSAIVAFPNENLCPREILSMSKDVVAASRSCKSSCGVQGFGSPATKRNE